MHRQSRKTLNHYSYLNPKQRRLLTLLYKFRFLTAQHLALITTSKKSSIIRSLQVLIDLGYIKRNYDLSYKINRLPATYYLLLQGIRYLVDEAGVAPAAVPTVYRNPKVTQQFITQCLRITDSYLALKPVLPASYQLFAKAELITDESLPRPLPDLFLSAHTGQRDCMLIQLDTTLSHVPIQRLKHYLTHYEEVWPFDTYPILLFVCLSPSAERTFRTKAARFIEYVDADEFRVLSTNHAALQSIQTKPDIWTDLADPNEQIDLAAATGY